MLTRRTGKVLSISRAILAVVFLLALWVDPVQPARAPDGGYLTLALYLIWSAALVLIAWESWWIDFRLARLVHAVDIVAFIAAVYITETGNGDFSSPFMAFAAFLLISATLRWGWNGVAYTALTLIVVNGLMGGMLMAMHMDLDLYRFGRRQTYMVVLSIMMVWLSTDRRNPRTPPLPEPEGVPGERRNRVLAGILQHARTTLIARHAAIAIVREEEPWVEVLRDHDGIVTAERIGPDALAEGLDADHRTLIFDAQRGRAIVQGVRDTLECQIGPVALPLADHCGAGEGLAAGFTCAEGVGQLMVWGIPDPCTDDLPVIAGLAREAGLALDREQMASMAQVSAVTDIRNALARDLHDSVAQFLAGTLFRLEALRRWIREGNDPDHEINAMKEALRREQGQLRLMIDRLRRGEEGDRRTDIAEELDTLLEEMSHHWHIDTRLEAAQRPLPVPIQLAYEVRQIVREAVANAARHGQCRQVEITLGASSEGQLRLFIGDDGTGFPSGSGMVRPRSISERVEALGGRLIITDASPGAMLDIFLPTRIAA
jgi:signal transduction histidine kinase